MNSTVSLPFTEGQPRVRRSTSIANHLRQMIFSGALKPGDRLPTEEQLCKYFSVSRTTLRESVQMLRVSGLLDVTPGRGSFICLPDPTALISDLALLTKYNSMNDNDISSLRVLLEVEMVRQACDASADRKKILQNYLVNNQTGADAIEETEKNWHMAIAKLAGNELSATMLQALLHMQKPERLTQFAKGDEVMRVMGVQIRLNAAIAEGDKNMATRVMSNYLGSLTPQFKN